MSIWSLTLIFGLIVTDIRSDFLGYHELNLIEERKPFKIKCLSKDQMPDYFDVSEIKWFNVTIKSTDRYDLKHQHILLDDTNEFLTIRSNGELYSSSAKPEHNGYYSCRIHYFDRRHYLKRRNHKLIDYRLHLIEVTKRPLIYKLEEFIVIEVYADIDSVNNEKIDPLLRDLVLNREFKTNIHSENQTVLCKFNTNLNLMKCQFKIKSESKKKCHKNQCISDQNIFEQNVENDLQEIRTLFKANEEHFKSNLDTTLIDFEIRRVDQEPNCPEGYYSYSNRCRPCHPGKYRTKEENNCRNCPINSYSPYFGQPWCMKCPESSRTAVSDFGEDGKGATHIHECKFFYSLGFYGFIKDLFNN